MNGARILRDCLCSAAVLSNVLISVPTQAQEMGWKSSLTATAQVRVVAYMPGSVSVSAHRVPISFHVSKVDREEVVTLPITTTWNVNPAEVTGVETIAYFQNPDRALSNDSGAAISSAAVRGSVNGSAYRAFNETNRVGPARSSLRLFEQPISQFNHRARRDDSLALKLDRGTAAELPDAEYSGVLHIEARYF